MKDTMVALVIESLPAVVIALFGGFVSIFTHKQKRFTIKMFVGGLLAAAFVGLLLNLMLLEAGASETTRVITVSLGGYCARDVLEALSRRFLSQFKDDDDDKEDKDDNG